MRARFAAAFALALAGALTIACGGIVSPSQNTVETFSGTIPPGDAHPFSASKTGEIQVKLTALAPVSSTFVGMISAQVISGRYCLVVYDYIGFTAPETYTVTVSHP